MDQEEETFSLKLSHEQAWMLQSLIKPNAAPKDLPAHIQLFRRLALPLRERVNDAILRFADEADLEEVIIDCEVQHGWLIDSILSYDGNGGSATDLLIQCFRGMWGIGYHLPTVTAEESPNPFKPEEHPDTPDFAQA
jgi:hypothetical protein